MSQPGTPFQERFEIKYWVPERLTPTVASFAAAYLRVDPYQAQNGQRVSSLYLDTPGQAFYQAHLKESPDRAKLRIRVYGEALRGPAFFELKRKVKSVVVKHRAAVPLDRVAGLLAGDYQAIDMLAKKDRNGLQAFLYLAVLQRAEPALLVTCRREAYASQFDDDVRVTIDRDIAYQPALAARLDGDPKAWIAVNAPVGRRGEAMVLLELKFRGLAPFWMERLVRLLELEELGFSKYVASVGYEFEERSAALQLTPSVWI